MFATRGIRTAPRRRRQRSHSGRLKRRAAQKLHCVDGRLQSRASCSGHLVEPHEEPPMIRKTAADFHPQALKLFDQYVHGQLSRRDFLQRAAGFAAGRHDGRRIAGGAEPAFRRGRAGHQADDARIKTALRRISLAQRLRHGARLSGAACEGQGQAAGGPGGARKSRAQSAHRRHRAAPRASTTSSPSPPTR